MKQTKQFMQHMLLVLVGLVSAISVKAASYDFKAENSDGVTIYYKVSGDEATVVAGDEKYAGAVAIPEIVTNDGKEYAVTEIGNRAFYECSMLTSVIIPEKVAKIGGSCFYGCSALSHIDIPSSISIIPSWAFYGCSALRELELPQGVLTIDNYAFRNCTSMASVTLPNTLTSIGEQSFFNTKIETLNIPNSVTLLGGGAFWGCDELKNIYLPSSLTFIGSNAFYDYPSKIENIYTSIVNPFPISDDVFHSTTKKNAILIVPTGTKEAYQNTEGWDFANIVEMEPENNAYAVWCEGNTTLYFLTSSEAISKGETYDGQSVTAIWSGADVTKSGNMPEWIEVVKDKVTNIVIKESFKMVQPLSTRAWFYFNEKLESISGIENLNTCEVTDMSYMFGQCSSLYDIDVANFNTTKVTNMYGMFAGCSNLLSIDVSKFNTANVTDMTGLFYNCNNLNSLVLSNFDTSKVTTMSAMFQGCTNLIKLDISSFNTENVTSMQAMFYSCGGLKTIDLSSFNTDNVTDMCWMFYNCNDLTSIDLSHFRTSRLTEMRTMFGECLRLEKVNLSNWDISHVTNLRSLFYNCTQLKEVDLSNLNTQNVTTMKLMFLGCYNLKEVDLSSFNTANVEAVDSMFRGCTVLEKIYVGDGWNMDKVITHKEMFDRCYKIVGGNGTTYNSSYTNVTYARIDTEDAPGYLTYKAAKSTQTISLTTDIQTFCSDKDLDFTGVEGLKAYIASGFSPLTGEVVMSSVTQVPAKTGLLLVGTAGQEYEVPFMETDFIYSNLLRGLLEDVEVTNGYVLNGNEFVAVDEAVTVKGGEAYLNVEPVASASRLAISFTDATGLSDAAGIDTVILDNAATSGTWYTLQGVRLEGKPSKQGIYLHQGRKVVVK